MKLSILIPMYNAQQYIENCLNSLVSQDLSKSQYEIIVMDDGSTDNFPVIVKEYSNRYENIKLLCERNEGAYKTRNKLLKLAKGKYIYNIDADDYITHNSLGTILELAENTNVDMFSFKTRETSDLNIIETPTNLLRQEVILSDGYDFLKKHRDLRHEVWWYFVRRDLIESLDLKFSNNQYNADVLFTLELLVNAKQVAYFPVSIHRYVINDMSIMRKDTQEAKLKRIENIMSMVVDKSNFILNLNQSNSNNETELINNLKYRRDLFTFFTMIKMVQANFSVKKIKKEIQRLQNVEAYSISNFKDEKYDALKYKVLNFILNNKRILYSIVSFRNAFFNLTSLMINKKPIS